MNNVYKYGFYVFILVSFTLFNIWNISTTELKNKGKNEHDKSNKQLESLQKSNIILDRNVPEIYGYEVIKGKKDKIISKDSTYLLFLLSEFDCSKCQENELKNASAIKERLMSYGIKVLCITKKEKLNRIIVQMRSMNIKIPLFFITDDEFARLSFDIEYPQIELIHKGVVVSAFLPVKQDYEFSSKYYNRLLAGLNAENL